MVVTTGLTAPLPRWGTPLRRWLAHRPTALHAIRTLVVGASVALAIVLGDAVGRLGDELRTGPSIVPPTQPVTPRGPALRGAPVWLALDAPRAPQGGAA